MLKDRYRLTKRQEASELALSIVSTATQTNKLMYRAGRLQPVGIAWCLI